jgi:hypothetical protein
MGDAAAALPSCAGPRGCPDDDRIVGRLEERLNLVGRQRSGEQESLPEKASICGEFPRFAQTGSQTPT